MSADGALPKVTAAWNPLLSQLGPDVINTGGADQYAQLLRHLLALSIQPEGESYGGIHRLNLFGVQAGNVPLESIFGNGGYAI